MPRALDLTEDQHAALAARLMASLVPERTYRAAAAMRGTMVPASRGTDWDAIRDGMLRARLAFYPRMMRETPAPMRHTARTWDLRTGRTAHAYPGGSLMSRNVGSSDPFAGDRGRLVRW